MWCVAGRSPEAGVSSASLTESVCRRSWERERERERGPPGGGASLGRDRSLSPRSKEVQREIQAARERRAGTKGAS